MGISNTFDTIVDMGSHYQVPRITMLYMGIAQKGGLPGILCVVAQEVYYLIYLRVRPLI